MTWLNRSKMRLVCVGLAAVVVLGGGTSTAEIIMSEPVNLGPVINDAQDMQECDFSHDGLELYFSTNRPGGYGRADIWVAKRDTLNSPWQEPVNLGPNVNSVDAEVEPSISGDGLELYLGSWDDYILRVCTRPSKDAPWGSPVKIGPPVGSGDAFSSDISADGLSLYFASTRAGGYGGEDIWVATRATKSDPWTEPVNLGPNVNTGSKNWSPTISTDGLTLIFNSRRLWASTRKSVEDSWEPAVNLGIYKEGNQGWQHGAALSPDDSCVYMQAYTSQWGGYGGGDFWKVEFTPIVDFNADGIVDSADMFIMGDNWHAHCTLCDIAPLPLGDAYVDVKDLLVLAEYLEPGDPTLIAHWALDEVEGDVAYDSVGTNDGTVMGEALWQPDSGLIDGALALDGVDDYVLIDRVINPMRGPLSVFAWIKGGGPGQVVLSQQAGANWLMTDASEGKLMTELGVTADGSELYSETGIIDGDWHRVGFVWDGSARMLYVDDVRVAEDVQTSVASAYGRHYLGCAKDFAPTTFFSGLIDDVRIYKRAVKP